jgi:hypothetical protein
MLLQGQAGTPLALINSVISNSGGGRWQQLQCVRMLGHAKMEHPQLFKSEHSFAGVCPACLPGATLGLYGGHWEQVHVDVPADDLQLANDQQFSPMISSSVRDVSSNVGGVC